MAAHTTLKRGNRYLKLRWGWWHVECLWQAMVDEVGEEALVYPRTYMCFPNSGPFTFSKEHRFVDDSDGEVFVIKPGDVYDAHG